VLRFDLHLPVPTRPDLGLHFSADLARESRLEIVATSPRRFERGSAILGVEGASFGGVSTELGFDSERPGTHVFFALLAHLRLSRHVEARAVVGTQRGGVKCVQGVCREFPPFGGARVQLDLSY